MFIFLKLPSKPPANSDSGPSIEIDMSLSEYSNRDTCKLSFPMLVAEKIHNFKPEMELYRWIFLMANLNIFSNSESNRW